MTGRNDQFDGDDEDAIRGIALAAFHEHERSVSTRETEAALAEVRARIDGSNDARRQPVLVSVATGEHRSSRWIVLAAAAAAVAIVVGGLVVGLGGDETGTIVPASVDDDTATPTIETSSTAPPVSVEQTTPTTGDPSATVVDPSVVDTIDSTAVDPSGLQTISVDASNPPPILDPQPFVVIPWAADGRAPGDVAVSDVGVVLNGPADKTLTFVPFGLPGAPDAPYEVPTTEQIGSLAAGPGFVAYGIGDPVFSADNNTSPRGFRYLAVALEGTETGAVLSSSEIDAMTYLELPPMVFGHGGTGIIDRLRSTNEQVIGYVAADGEPVTLDGEHPPLITRDPESDVVTSAVGDREVSWKLDILRSPTAGSTFVGPSPAAPTSDGRVIVFDRIGDAIGDGDFPESELPVIAILEPDGSGRWVRLPDDWDVVASDIWGTVLLRHTADSVELAMLDDALETASSADPEALPIANHCVAEFECTQLAGASGGRIVAYDPSDNTLTTYAASGEVAIESRLTEPLADIAPRLVAVGPDDVAYFTTQTPGTLDPSNDLIAIPLTGDAAGTVVARYTGLDGSGDSTLVPTDAGLAVVGCCSGADVRPAADALTYPFVDGTGSPIGSTAPIFGYDFTESGNTLIRVDGETTSTFVLPTVFNAPRDIPRTVATADGGALATDYIQTDGGQHVALVRFSPDWPANGIDNTDVFILNDDISLSAELLLEPSGTVVIADGDHFTRRTLEEIATPGWSGRIEIDPSFGPVTAPDLNSEIERLAPVWASDPVLLAYQLVPSVQANERLVAQFDEASGVLTITTTGLLDDSVSATQIVVQTERAPDGLLRFVSGTYGVQCAPGRGHQDFSTQLCI